PWGSRADRGDVVVRQAQRNRRAIGQDRGIAFVRIEGYETCLPIARVQRSVRSIPLHEIRGSRITERAWQWVAAWSLRGENDRTVGELPCRRKAVCVLTRSRHVPRISIGRIQKTAFSQRELSGASVLRKQPRDSTQREQATFGSGNDLANGHGGYEV